MSVRLLEWLLDLKRIRLGRDAPIYLQWHLPVDRWVLFTFGLLAALLILWTYAHEHGSVWRRLVPALLRAALVALVGAMLCAPVLVLQRNRVEPSHVAVLVDTSASMARKDTYLDTARGAQIVRGAGLPAEGTTLSEWSRLDLVRRALLRDAGAVLRTIGAQHQVQLFAFTDRAHLEAEAPVREPANSAKPQDSALRRALEALVADGSATDVPGAVRAMLQRTDEGPLSAIVIFSDGQTTEPSSLEDAIEAGRAAQVPVYTVPIGAPEPPRDVAVTALPAEENAFVRDLLALRVRVTCAGLTEQTPVHVRLFEEESGERKGSTSNAAALAAETVELSGAESTNSATPAAAVLELRTRPTRAGRLRYRVEAEPIPGELDLRNNVVRIEINILDDQVRLLYVEGYPRYDYRYLKNALLREPTIRFGALLLSADARFAQEGTEPVRRFPETPQELEPYDVVLFGDVDPGGDWLSPAQMNMLVDFVGQRGGGFGVIAGERSAPQRFRGTPLEKLIPVRIDPDFTGSYETNLTKPYRPQLTDEGRRSRIFRFDPDPAVSARIFDNLPGWYWVARTLGPRPAAEVLLEHPEMQTLTGPMPLVVLGRYGAGRTFFQASDDTWRWRRHTGEWLVDAYWIQVIRALLQPRQVGQDRRLIITPEQSMYAYGQRCVVRVEVRDEETLTALEQNPRLIVYDSDNAPVEKVALDRLGPASRLFEGSFVAPHAGQFLIQAEAVLPAAGQRPASALVRVENADIEGRRPQADEIALQRLAEQTGGAVVPLDRLGEALAAIPDRSVRIPDDVSEPLWDTKLVFALFILIIGTEWVLRKVFGML